MATFNWPSSLPQCWSVEGYTEQQEPMVIRSEVDVGPAKVRRRFTKPITAVAASLMCDLAQVQTIKSFFTTTLAGGVHRFTFMSPTTGQLEEYRFIEAPTFSPASRAVWKVDFLLEQF